MKRLLLIATITIFASCAKDRGECYHCTHGTSNGVQNPDTEYCGDISNYHPKDAQGNDMQVFCKKK